MFNVGIAAGAFIGAIAFDNVGVRSTALVGGLIALLALTVVLIEPHVRAAAGTRRGPSVVDGTP